ncbi:MAG: tetratricopeptide repeat protein [Chloroflexota bacterium]
MRAREGLADCLWNLGQREEAIRHYREMLRLNPNGNQGIRYRLLFCLLEIGDTLAGEMLLKEYEEEGTATWLYTRALVTCVREGDSPAARHVPQGALEQNRQVVPYLAGRRRLHRQLPEYVGIGDRDEAIGYVAEFGELWTRTPGAL